MLADTTDTQTRWAASDKNRGTTAFTNKAPLLGYMRKIDTPGGGEYDPKRMDHYNSYSKKGLTS